MRVLGLSTRGNRPASSIDPYSARQTPSSLHRPAEEPRMPTEHRNPPMPAEQMRGSAAALSAELEEVERSNSREPDAVMAEARADLRQRCAAPDDAEMGGPDSVTAGYFRRLARGEQS
jgi:hypothetical protein